MLDVAAALIAGLVTTLSWGIADVRLHEGMGLGLVLVWPLTLFAYRAYDVHHLGSGTDEFRRVAHAGLLLVALLGTISYVQGTPNGRPWVVSGLPLAIALTFVLRLANRRALQRARRAGRNLRRVIAVGEPAAVADLVRQTAKATPHGLVIVGACVADPEAGLPDDADVPVVGGLSDVARAVELLAADAVAVLPGSPLTGVALRRLAWQLEATRVELYVGTGIVEVAGPRISVHPVSGVPLLHLRKPEFTGGRRVIKGLFDRVGALALLIAFSPLFLTVALAIKLDDGGPIYYRQVRAGRNETEFKVWKFRTMVPDADRRVAELLADSDRDGPMFKMKRDPRVTRVGRILRRYSLDELPQLMNVVAGEMSLVGPRPPLPREVSQYADDEKRRLYVKPGMTGLWQVSGRADLPWEECVQLDLRYVENWSLALDFEILWKTAGAVVKGQGAY